MSWHPLGLLKVSGRIHGGEDRVTEPKGPEDSRSVALHSSAPLDAEASDRETTPQVCATWYIVGVNE